MSGPASAPPRPQRSRSRIVPGSRLGGRWFPILLAALALATLGVVVLAVGIAFGPIPSP